jgi:hypothetical protein
MWPLLSLWQNSSPNVSTRLRRAYPSDVVQEFDPQLKFVTFTVHRDPEDEDVNNNIHLLVTWSFTQSHYKTLIQKLTCKLVLPHWICLQWLYCTNFEKHSLWRWWMYIYYYWHPHLPGL